MYAVKEWQPFPSTQMLFDCEAAFANYSDEMPNEAKLLQR